MMFYHLILLDLSFRKKIYYESLEREFLCRKTHRLLFLLVFFAKNILI